MKSLFATIASVLTLSVAGVAQAQPFAYVANQSANTVSIINTANETVVATVPVGTGPRGVAVDSQGKRVYVANITSNSVSVIETVTNTVLSTIPVGTGPRALAVNPAGTRVYVSNSTTNNVSVVDTTTNTVIATVPVGVAPRGVAVNPAGTRVFVANSSNNNVSVIDATTNTVLTTIGVGTNPFGVAINPAGTRVYVTNQNTNDVAVIDATNNTFLSGIVVGSVPQGIAINPAGTRAYVTNLSGSSLSVIDITSNTVLATVPVGASPVGVGVNPAGTKVYVSIGGANNVSVIDAGSNTLLTSVAVGAGPGGLAVGPILPPSAPNLGSVTPGDSFVSVAFTPPASDGGAPITSYSAKSNPGNIIGTGTGSPVLVTGLTNGTSYTFTVVATNSAGTGPPSAVSAAVVPAGPPVAPSGVTATPNNGQATVTFTGNSSNGSPTTGYTVSSSPGGGVDLNAGTTGLSHTITGLTNGTAYTFTVVATNAVGSSSPSAPSNSVIPAGAPNAPTIGTATGGNASASVNFTPPANNGSAITSYTVTANPGGPSVTGTGSPIFVSGLINGSTYTFTVTATNAIGTSPASAASNSVTPSAPTVPGAPSAVVATAGNASATVSFKAPAANGSPITGYTVTSRPAGGVDVNAGTTALSHSITGLSNGTAYTFTVVATNAVGPSSPSAPSNSVVPAGGLGASQRAVLTNLYSSTNGASWTNKTNWNGAVGTECTWFGVTCDTAQNNVVAINLGSNNLVGTLPALSGLPALQTFNVSINQLTGPIPSLGGLTALLDFRVNNNLLSGPIPSLTGLTALVTIVASNNQLTGSIPSLTGLTSLQQFTAPNNQLTGSIPSLSGLTALQQFGVSINQLTGPIPSLTGLTALVDFNAFSNGFTGSIPSLTGLTALQSFQVSTNQLTGPIPSLSGLTGLLFLLAGNNQLTGSIPSLSGLNLVAIEVNNNQLTGPVPTPPASLLAGQSKLCSNSLTTSGVAATDTAWNTATGVNWQACQVGAAAPACTLSASPTSILVGGTSTLTASCTPAATSFTWTGGTCAGTNATTCTVTPTATTTYTFAGTNVVGTGKTASATIAVSTTVAAPALSLSPQFINFGSRTVNTTSLPATVVLTNSGTVDLIISSIQGSGDFGFTSTCPISSAAVAPASSCAVNITFTPLTAAGIQGAITITSNAPGSPHRIQLFGTGTATSVATISVNTDALAFGAQIINTTSAAQNVIITNTGFANLLLSNVVIVGPFSRFALSTSASPADCASTVAPQSSCQFAIVFRPTTIGAQSGQITIPNNASDTPLTISLSGNGTPNPVPVIKVSDVLAFGDQVLNSASTVRNLIVSNTGAAPLLISAFRLAGNNPDNFSVTGQSTCASIAPDASCTLAITFTPTTIGAKTAQIIFASNAENATSVNTTALTGNGILAPRPLVTLSTSVIGFGNVIFGGATPNQIVILTNPGGQVMSISRIDVTGDFVQTNNCGTSLAPLASCTINIGFAPLGTGPLSGEFIVISNAATSPDRIQLGGTGCRWFSQSKSRLFLTVC